MTIARALAKLLRYGVEVSMERNGSGIQIGAVDRSNGTTASASTKIDVAADDQAVEKALLELVEKINASANDS
jgi:hypothetical protein